MARPVSPVVVLVLAVVLGAASSSARAQEDYFVTAAAEELVVSGRKQADDGGLFDLISGWSVSCVAQEPGPTATMRPGGKDLRFVEAPQEQLAYSVAGEAQPLGEEVVGGYVYEDLSGVHVFARFSAACGTNTLQSSTAVETAAVVVPPTVHPAARVQRADDATPLSAEALPLGVEVELVDLVVVARPRGDETVTLSFTGAGVDGEAVLTPTDFGSADGVLVTPRLTPTEAGTIQVQAQFLGTVSNLIVLTAVDDDFDPTDGGPGGEPSPRTLSCASSSLAPWALPALPWFWRRRRLAHAKRA